MLKQAFHLFVIVLQAAVAGAIIMQIILMSGCVSFSPSKKAAAFERQCARDGGVVDGDKCLRRLR